MPDAPTDWPNPEGEREANVFEHQHFLLRRPPSEAFPHGERVRRSFRNLVTATDEAGQPTDADEPFALDYPREFFNVAALSLLAYLAQVAFEPGTADALAGRLRAPLTEAEFEAAVAPLRSHFRVDGPGARFMQGAAPEGEKDAEPLAVAMMTSRKGEAAFLNRAERAWAVAPDQAGLLLFMRNTFYEGTGGRGYQKGTNGDTPARVLVTAGDPGGSDAVRLRRSVWLNVLHRARQRDGYEGDYAEPGAGYDGRMWEALPPGPVGVGEITLRAGLGWMTAFHFLHFEDTGETFACAVTGEPITGRVARRATKRSTGVAYGAKGDVDAGVRADRLFRHPNVPTYKTLNAKTGDYENEQAYGVGRVRGLVDALGSAFFGSPRKGESRESTLAPVVAQLHDKAVKHEAGRSVRLAVFGFHMLSAQKNVHGWYELDTFRYRVLGESEADAVALGALAEPLVRAAGGYASAVAGALQRAVQTTAGAGVRASVDEKGRVVLGKPETKKASDYSFGRDTVADFWRGVQAEMHTLVDEIGRRGTSPEALAEAGPEIARAWETRVARHARDLYRPIFEQYGTLPRTMPYAFAARKKFRKDLAYASAFQDADTSAAPSAPTATPLQPDLFA